MFVECMSEQHLSVRAVRPSQVTTVLGPSGQSESQLLGSQVMSGSRDLHHPLSLRQGTPVKGAAAGSQSFHWSPKALFPGLLQQDRGAAGKKAVRSQPDPLFVSKPSKPALECGPLAWRGRCMGSVRGRVCGFTAGAGTQDKWGATCKGVQALRNLKVLS